MAILDVGKIDAVYKIKDERHPYNIWGFKNNKKKRPKFKKKKNKNKKGHIDLYV
jgi:hypothetical protein